MIDLLWTAKALHVIGFVSWFAGLFFLVRLFVYHTEAWERPEPEKSILAGRFAEMEGRVYRIICDPAMNITWAAGLTMLGLGLFADGVPNYFKTGTPGWMYLKLALVFVLTGYQYWCKQLMKELAEGRSPFSPWQFRLLNEAPTLFLAAIAFTAVFGKAGNLNYVYLALGVGLFGVLVYRGAVAYRKRRGGD